MDGLNVIIAGSRGFSDYEIVCKYMDMVLDAMGTENLSVVSGNAQGADKLGERWSREVLHKEPILFPITVLDWKRYGRAAGPLRNKKMADVSQGLVAFWDGKSTGTKNMIDTMKSQGKWHFIINLSGPKEILYDVYDEPYIACMKYIKQHF